MKTEIKKRHGSGFIAFNRDTKRYYFDNLNENEVKKIHQEGFNFPLRIQWRITKNCNLNCKHCYLNQKNLKQDELSKKDIVKIARKIVKNGVFEVLITGGEPTVKDGIKEVLNILCKNCSVTLFTNAQDKRNLLKLIPIFKKNKKRLKIIVSLDGNKKIHDNIRGKGNFNKTINNIKLLSKNNLDITINTVLTKQFIPYLDDYIKKIKNLNVEAIQFSKFYPLGEGENFIRSMLTSLEFKDILKKLLKISKKIKKPAIVFDYNFCFLLGEKKSLITHRKCSGGFSKLVIESNGDAYPCQLLTLKKFKMGNILKDSIQKIWNSKNREKFIKDFFPEECKKCDKNKFCNCGCKASSYSIHKAFKYKDPYCFYGK